MAADFAEIEAEATKLEEVVPSVVAIINGIAGIVAEAVAADNAGDNSKLAGLAGRIRAQATTLAEAAVAGTPAEPPA